MKRQDIIERLAYNLDWKQQRMKEAIIAVKKGDYERVRNNLITNLDKAIPLIFYDFFTDKDK